MVTSYRNGTKAKTLSFDASTTSRRLTLPAATGTWARPPAGQDLVAADTGEQGPAPGQFDDRQVDVQVRRVQQPVPGQQPAGDRADQVEALPAVCSFGESHRTMTE